ncbi:THxN family PEP-CTERM protein [Coleofasciculus sp. H7-2]|uniref:THxN family PEP-CTERM protein n=1 Tax=Coleofasciculus sp. H7-2 TaxID=3351545 RepID=UPI0036707FD8
MANVKTSGIWANVTGEANASAGNLNGVGTNQIIWGTPYLPKNPEGKQSAYRFDGVDSKPLPLDGTDFLLGTFTHVNYRIQGSSILSANLKLTLEIEGGLKKEFNFIFNHNETPNDGVNGTCPATPGYNPPCPDIVSVPTLQSHETVTVDGKEYALSITGFLQDSKVVNQFITQEDRDNSAQLYGKLVEAKPPVEPRPPVTVEPRPQVTVQPPAPVAVQPRPQVTVEPRPQVTVESLVPQYVIIPQPGGFQQPGFMQPGQSFVYVIGQPGFMQPGQSFVYVIGQPGFAIGGQPGGFFPGQPGFAIGGQPGGFFPGQSGGYIPGQPGGYIPGQGSIVIQGQPGGFIPGQPGGYIPGQPGGFIPGQPGGFIPGQPGGFIPGQGSIVIQGQPGGYIPGQGPTVIQGQPGGYIPGQPGGFIPGQPGGFIPGQPGGYIPGQGPTVIPGQPGGYIPGQPGGFIPGQPGGFIPGQPGGYIPGQGPTVIPGQPGGYIPGQGPTVIPGQPGGYIPGQGPTVIQGQPGGYIPGQPGGYIPGQPGGYIPGQPGGYIPGQGPTVIQGQPGGYIPGQGPTVIQGQPGGYIPGQGQGPTVVPGQAGGYIPGQGPTVIQGQPGGYIPGQGPTVIQGQPGGYIPGQGPTVVPGQAGVIQQMASLVITLTTSGIWSSVVEEASGFSYLNGVGTNQISWGIPYNTQGFQSGYRFDSSGTTYLPFNGSYFALGAFTHYNYPISGYSIRSANLKLTLNINGTNVEFNFLFSHNETQNEGVNGVCPVTPGYAPPCPDVIAIANVQSQESVMINGKQYVLYILGFLQNGQIVNQFITFENQLNSAQLFGQLVEAQSPVARPIAVNENPNLRSYR